MTQNTLPATEQPHDPHDNEHLMQDLSRPKKPAEYLRLFGSGFAMGAADIVPGVSGGTMAFILGVYETLIDAIKSFNFDAIRLALGLKIRELLEHVPWRFLLALGLGILTAIFLLTSFLEEMLLEQPTFVFAFFGGLIVASVIAIGAKVRWSAGAIGAVMVGAVVAFFVVGLPSLGDAAGHAPPVLFFSGMIAICAMILPGISGSFILLILGQYDYIISAVRGLQIVDILSVAVGAVIGLLAFSRVLSWLLKHFENTTIAVLTGFMAGSLRLIVHRMLYVTEETEAGTEITRALELSAGDVAIALGLALVGFLLVSVIDHLQSRDNPVLRLVWR